jgi:chorismate mutase
MDDEVARYRERITELDRLILDAVNRRLRVVAELKAYKDWNDIGFVDPGREEAMLAERLAENEGPLSEEGLRAFHAELLALMKRELG